MTETLCINDFYKEEINALYDLMCIIWLRDRSTYDKLKLKLEQILTLVINLHKSIELVRISDDKPINFNNFDIYNEKNKIANITFFLINYFTDFMTLFDSAQIKKYYDNIVSFNWLIYIIYTLFQNAFGDALSDDNGRITIESIIHINNNIYKSNEIIARSIQGLLKNKK
jgi:hypothetical protein